MKLSVIGPEEVTADGGLQRAETGPLRGLIPGYLKLLMRLKLRYCSQRLSKLFSVHSHTL